MFLPGLPRMFPRILLRGFLPVSCALLLVLLPPLAAPQASAGMPTVEAARFTQLEARLSRALAARDAAALRTLLAGDFELRDAANSSELLLRDDWLSALSAAPAPPACTPREVMPRSFGDIVVVSLVCAAGDGHRDFLIDLWRQHGSRWQLAARYRSNAPLPPTSNPHTRH